MPPLLFFDKLTHKRGSPKLSREFLSISLAAIFHLSRGIEARGQKGAIHSINLHMLQALRIFSSTMFLKSITMNYSVPFHRSISLVLASSISIFTDFSNPFQNTWQ